MANKFRDFKTFTATVSDGTEYTFSCLTQSTNYGFRHVCCLDFVSNPTSRDIFVKACYYNRTWESFKYETVLRKAIEKMDVDEDTREELKERIINKTEREEAQACEATLKEFKELYNGLSDKNKEALKNTPPLETGGQVKSVINTMRVMTAMQLICG